MVKELMHDPIFLAGKSEIATKEDLQVAQDLLDTLMAHRDQMFILNFWIVNFILFFMNKNDAPKFLSEAIFSSC